MKLIILITVGIILSSCSHHSKYPHHYKGHHAKKMMKKADFDTDGKIIKDEWNKFHESKFLKLDANNDKAVTTEEIMAYDKQRKKDCKKQCQLKKKSCHKK